MNKEQLQALINSLKGKSTLTDDEKKQLADAEVALAKLVAAESVTMTKAELDAMIKKVVDIEKDKLYETLDATKKTNEKLQKQVEELVKSDAEKKAEAERIKQEAEKKAEDERKSKLDEVARVQEELIASNNRVNELMQGMEALKGVVQRSEEDRKAAEARAVIAAYIKDKIASANGEIIAELVTGNSIEEVDASIERAKVKYQEIVKKREEQIKEQYDLQAKVPGASAMPSQRGGGGDFKVLSQGEVARLTPEEYKKYKAELFTRFGVRA